MQVAQLGGKERPGFLLDYNLVTTAADVTFQADKTYYVSGPVTLSGNVVFEGGSVIKNNTNGAIIIYPTEGMPTVACRASAYRPIIFTARDDQSVGETIIGSSNAPSGYYGNPVLYMSGLTPPPLLTHFRISYASYGVQLAPNSAEISDAQFVNCANPIGVGGETVHLRNVLMAGSGTNVGFLANGGSLVAENVTFSGSTCLGRTFGSGAALILTNCILADITNLTSGDVTLSGDTNGFWNSPTVGNVVTNTVYPFQTAGAGSFYLANNCAFRNAGTTNINSALLSSLAQKTTYPQ